MQRQNHLSEIIQGDFADAAAASAALEVATAGCSETAISGFRVSGFWVWGSRSRVQDPKEHKIRPEDRPGFARKLYCEILMVLLAFGRCWG